MSQQESIEMKDAAKSQVTVDASGKPDTENSVYNQTRTRRVFSFSQLFAFSLTYMSLWEGMCT